jgi:hypothetical protein
VNGLLVEMMDGVTERSLKIVALRSARTTLMPVLVVVAMKNSLGGASRLFDLIGIRLDSPHIDNARSLAKHALLTIYPFSAVAILSSFHPPTSPPPKLIGTRRALASARHSPAALSLPCRTLPERLELLSTLLGLSVSALTCERDVDAVELT